MKRTLAMSIRPATLQDAEDIATLHVAAWKEAYTGLLPASELARRDLTSRRSLWNRILSTPRDDVVIAPGKGFAMIGPQRDAQLTPQGIGAELYSLYLLRAHHGSGLGKGLFEAARAARPGPMSVLVLDQNARARAFYVKMGGRAAGVRQDDLGDVVVTDRLYLFNAPD